MLGEIHRLRRELRSVLRTPRRWEGGLRRSALARNIRGSNSIEGYDVAEDDAAAAIDGEEPFSADEGTFLEIQGYRQALGYVLAMSDADYATFDTTELRAMHYMMLSHDLSKSPGRYRKGPIYVHDERSDRIVYEAPDAADVPELMEALAASLHSGLNSDPVIRSAMAHLNLVMIHPFRDGNGRMARALATLVLTRSDIGEPEFSSIEEWLGANTEDYYSVLAHTGHGTWRPRGRRRTCGWHSTFGPITCRLRRSRGESTKPGRRGTRSSSWPLITGCPSAAGCAVRRGPRLPRPPRRVRQARRHHRSDGHQGPRRACLGRCPAGARARAGVVTTSPGRRSRRSGSVVVRSASRSTTRIHGCTRNWLKPRRPRSVGVAGRWARRARSVRDDGCAGLTWAWLLGFKAGSSAGWLRRCSRRWSAWVPEPPEPVSVRHLPDWGLTRAPLGWRDQVWAPVPLQS